MAVLQAWLFIDKVRGVATFIVLLIVMGLLGYQAWSPRPVKLEPESFNAIKNATDEIRRVANSSEQLVKDNEEFKTSLRDQMQAQAKLRDANYELLFKEYGIGSVPDNFTLGGPTADRLQQQPVGTGGGAVHPDAGRPNNVQRLRDAAGHYPEAVNQRSPGVSGGNSSPPSEQGERPGGVAGKK